jgi:hypothetical protein
MSAPIACNGESPDLRLIEHIRNCVPVHSYKNSNKLSDHVIVETSQSCILRLMAMLINDTRCLSKRQAYRRMIKSKIESQWIFYRHDEDPSSCLTNSFIAFTFVIGVESSSSSSSSGWKNNYPIRTSTIGPQIVTFRASTLLPTNS